MDSQSSRSSASLDHQLEEAEKDFNKLDRDIFLELHKLDHCLRFFRSINNSFNFAPCGHQRNLYFINWIKYLLVFYLGIRIQAITHDNDRDGVTIGKWLNSGSKKQTVDIKIWRQAKKAYSSLLKSNAFKTLRKTRDAVFAHNLDTKIEIMNLPDQTYNDLFGLVEKLKEIFSLAATSGMCAPTLWNSPHPGNIEINIPNMMNILEAASHEDKMHEFLIKRDSMKNAKNPELY